MIVSLEKIHLRKGGVLIIRTGKEKVRNMFGVKVLRLEEASGWDQKYGIRPVGVYVAVVGRVCNRHQNIFNLMISLRFFIVVIFP